MIIILEEFNPITHHFATTASAIAKQQIWQVILK